jgi:UDP-2-acetamido-2,6-beta-L-arabino-hexul-4-ose reductase
MNFFVIGTSGFIGSHLVKRIKEIEEDIVDNIKEADIIYYCAGVMRSNDIDSFYKVNYEMLKEVLKKSDNKPVVYLSSVQSGDHTDYGRSKKMAEELVLDYPNLIIFRLNNTFGSGARPNYNSVVSTFLYNIRYDIPIVINGNDTQIQINYIDDTINNLLDIKNFKISGEFNYIRPLYKISLGELASTIREFKEGKSPKNELEEKLYITYNQDYPNKIK